MNRVFSPDVPIDVEICETPLAAATAHGSLGGAAAAGQPLSGSAAAASLISDSPIPAAARSQSLRIPTAGRGTPPHRSPGQQQHPTSLILASVSLTVTVVAGLGLIGLNVWNQSQQAIRQERNMLMIERLRSMGPAEAQPAAEAADANLPPPPPAEPWMEELASLPASSAPPANVLKVPMSSRVDSPAPAASGSGRSGGGSSSGPSSSGGQGGGGEALQLVGVVQAQGHGGAAIFQIGNASTSAAVGEAIGSSGWRLRSATGDSAVIERGGEQRRMSISGGT